MLNSNVLKVYYLCRNSRALIMLINSTADYIISIYSLISFPSPNGCVGLVVGGGGGGGGYGTPWTELNIN